MELGEQQWAVESAVEHDVNEHQVVLDETRFYRCYLEVLKEIIVTKVLVRRARQPDQEGMLNAFQPLEMGHRCPDQTTLPYSMIERTWALNALSMALQSNLARRGLPGSCMLRISSPSMRFAFRTVAST